MPARGGVAESAGQPKLDTDVVTVAATATATARERDICTGAVAAQRASVPHPGKVEEEDEDEDEDEEAQRAEGGETVQDAVTIDSPRTNHEIVDNLTPAAVEEVPGGAGHRSVHRLQDVERRSVEAARDQPIANQSPATISQPSASVLADRRPANSASFVPSSCAPMKDDGKRDAAAANAAAAANTARPSASSVSTSSTGSVSAASTAPHSGVGGDVKTIKRDRRGHSWF